MLTPLTPALTLLGESGNSLDGRVEDLDRRVGVVRDLRIGRIPRAAGVVGDHRALDADVTN